MRFSIQSIVLATSSFAAMGASAASSCWATSTGVGGNFPSLADMHVDATQFCTQFAPTNPAYIVSSGRVIFGYQSASFSGNFANATTCLSSFNAIISDCYGTNPNRPATLGGTIDDVGSAHLVISFNSGLKL
ncbi:hypothetical protein GALMADRAFT_145496 [Galerina marginata CBS 339.88]|uniref:Uncharacterized protein n=1 Tax=Galerina marginata (strain CBS 339.88) TaxID=685588 RepID=A0A067SRT0_GALM3|nr:hypothetical protein GALMADRAFT_145496 [Galerina marginata CBS 339.88]